MNANLLTANSTKLQAQIIFVATVSCFTQRFFFLSAEGSFTRLWSTVCQNIRLGLSGKSVESSELP
jgi:hypothetical protein